MSAVFDDVARDSLFGGKGNDWFFDFSNPLNPLDPNSDVVSGTSGNDRSA